MRGSVHRAVTCHNHAHTERQLHTGRMSHSAAHCQAHSLTCSLLSTHRWLAPTAYRHTQRGGNKEAPSNRQRYRLSGNSPFPFIQHKWCVGRTREQQPALACQSPVYLPTVVVLHRLCAPAPLLACVL